MPRYSFPFIFLLIFASFSSAASANAGNNPERGTNPTISLSADGSQTSEENLEVITVTATLSEPAASSVRVCFDTSGAEPSDFSLGNIFVLNTETCFGDTIPIGGTQTTITVVARDDINAESPETLSLFLISNQTSPGYDLDATPLDIDIIDNDITADIELITSDVSVSESGTTSATITARLSRPVNNFSNFCISPSGDGHPFDVLVLGLNNTLYCNSIQAGLTERTFTIQARQDTEIEPTETITVTLIPANGSTQTGPNLTIVGTPVSIDIIDDDVGADISLSVDRPSLTEGSSDVATVTATLSQPVNNFTTFCLSGSGDAFPNDVDITPGTVNTFCYGIPIGQTSGSFEVEPRQDSIEEPVETATFALRIDPNNQGNPATGPNMNVTGMPVSIDVIDDDGPITADLAIHKFGSPDAEQDNGLAWEILVENNGPASITDARVIDNFSTDTDNIQWTCMGLDGGNCSSASGSGDLDELVDLPIGGAVLFEICADLRVYIEGGNISNTATVEVPVDTADPNENNNMSTAIIDDIGLFADGFEDIEVAPNCFN